MKPKTEPREGQEKELVKVELPDGITADVRMYEEDGNLVWHAHLNQGTFGWTNLRMRFDPEREVAIFGEDGRDGNPKRWVCRFFESIEEIREKLEKETREIRTFFEAREMFDRWTEEKMGAYLEWLEMNEGVVE